MELLQILVYDKQHYFFRLLKYELDHRFKFEYLKNSSDLINTKEYEMMVFVVYTEVDLYDFIKVREQWQKQILVCIHNKVIYENMLDIKGVVAFDVSKVRHEITKELHGFFDDLFIKTKYA
jgi:hypothetical protein